ncbi:EAL and HDOD domain-containing protein [Janthinobacterium agaricidamnosum]|uniref:EAL and HDOD domain-containing protein n=1 Tax=Janthinobacterium agaricidamnosum TaxID=55508 RepID=UPI00142F2C89|nr:HDOD domain-containing protein [Janthinobacterium agaricidamnosum]
MSTASLVFFDLLADRQGRPAALLLAGTALPPAGQAGCAACPELAQRYPCFFPDNSSAEAAAAWSVHGWSALSIDQLADAGEVFSGDWAPRAGWVRGNWYLMPAPAAAANQAASRALALRLMELVASDGPTDEIETLLRRDPRLSYHLLRLVNSAGVGGGRRVTSVNHAIMLLGRQQLRRWLNLMLFAARDGDPRSGMLLARAAVRARLMEALAGVLGLDKMHQEQAFISGLFSLLGVLFGTPLAQLLPVLALCQTVQTALLAREGELGALLLTIEAAEAGDFEVLGQHLKALQLPAEEWGRSVLAAHLWMLDVIAETTEMADRNHV